MAAEALVPCRNIAKNFAEVAQLSACAAQRRPGMPSIGNMLVLCSDQGICE